MNDKSVPVGGDFGRIFDHRDYLAMVSIPDEATCVLRAHLILEEVLNVWSNKVTSTDDLFRGGFVPFKTKLLIARNLGFDDGLFQILDRVNELRNRFSHRKGYVLEFSAIDALRRLVDAVAAPITVTPCETFRATVSGLDASGNRREIDHSWSSADNRMKLVILFVVLMLKITHWMQGEFLKRGIRYVIVESGAATMPR